MTVKNEQPTRRGTVELTEKEMDKTSAAGTDAVFDNFVGFYEITDTNGGIDQDTAGQTSFADAAFRLGHTLRKK